MQLQIVEDDVARQEVEDAVRHKEHLILAKFNAKSVVSPTMKPLNVGTGMNLLHLELMHVVTMLVILLDLYTTTLTLVPLLILLFLNTMVLIQTWTLFPLLHVILTQEPRIT
jgi:hypothetical protein